MEVRGGGIKEALERDGYAVVRNVFSPEEIARMRGEVTALLAACPVHQGGLIVGPAPLEADLARLNCTMTLGSPWQWKVSFLAKSTFTPIPLTIGTQIWNRRAGLPCSAGIRRGCTRS